MLPTYKRPNCDSWDTLRIIHHVRNFHRHSTLRSRSLALTEKRQPSSGLVPSEPRDCPFRLGAVAPVEDGRDFIRIRCRKTDVCRKPEWISHSSANERRYVASWFAPPQSRNRAWRRGRPKANSSIGTSTKANYPPGAWAGVWRGQSSCLSGTGVLVEEPLPGMPVACPNSEARFVTQISGGNRT